MQTKRYKDIKATLILLGIIALPTSVFIFSKYASNFAKEFIMEGILVIVFLGMLFTIWKAIRLIID